MLDVVGAGASGRGAAGRGATGQETGLGRQRSEGKAVCGAAQGRNEMGWGAEEDTRLGAPPFGMGLAPTGRINYIYIYI